jgi:hypothetical protein
VVAFVRLLRYGSSVCSEGHVSRTGTMISCRADQCPTLQGQMDVSKMCSPAGLKPQAEEMNKPLTGNHGMVHACSQQNQTINALQASRGHAWPTTKVAKQCSSRARALRACLNPPSGPLNLWRRRHLQTLQTVRSICRCGSITRSHMMGSRCLALSASGQMPSTSALSTSSMWSQSSTTGCTPTHRASMPS